MSYQIKLEGGHIHGGATIAEFPLVKMNTFARGLWQQYGLQTLATREEFNAKLDKGINDLQAKVGK